MERVIRFIKKYRLWLSGLFVFLAFVTVLPGRETNLLGYQSHCSFVPISTLLSLVVAAFIYWYGSR